MTHYEVLGIRSDASGGEVRDAYRRLARSHHPDRAASAVDRSAPVSMPDINEAYRVLNDPARRAVYDASLRSGGDVAAPPTTVRPESARPTARQRSGPPYPGPVSIARDFRPRRIPWRMVIGVVAATVVGLVVLSVLSEPADDPVPDGILNPGDCVTIQSDGDAQEVACTGREDLVVRSLIDFESTCPGGTSPLRDHQGMGTACVELVSTDPE